MKICIFSTYDNFFLKKLVLSILKKNKKHNFVFYFVSDYKNLNNILVKLVSLGILRSLKFLVMSKILDITKKDIISLLEEKHIIKENLSNIDIAKFIKSNKIDLILSINYPKIIPSKILNLCKYGGINHHLGKLPEFKGRYPVANAILNNAKYIYVTVHKMNKNIDSGDIILEQKISISKYNNNFVDIYKSLFKKSEKIISNSISLIESNKSFKKMKRTKKNYCKNLTLNQIFNIIFLKN